MRTQLELEVLGGTVGRRMARRRPGADDLPWGTLDPSQFTEHQIGEARAIWTTGVFTEYASAAAFAAMATAFLECGAPIDLSAAAGDIVVDELDHAACGSRLIMELGGAAPLAFDLALISPSTTPGVTPLVRAAELAIKTSCVGEALSISALSRSLATCDHPLVRAILDRLLSDEGAHAQLGKLFLAWASDRLTSDDRRHLGEVALGAIAVYQPMWRGRCASCEAPAALGGMPVQSHADMIVEAVRLRVVRPLARMGIDVDRDALEDVLAA